MTRVTRAAASVAVSPASRLPVTCSNMYDAAASIRTPTTNPITVPTPGSAAVPIAAPIADAVICEPFWIPSLPTSVSRFPIALDVTAASSESASERIGSELVRPRYSIQFAASHAVAPSSRASAFARQASIALIAGHGSTAAVAVASAGVCRSSRPPLAPSSSCTARLPAVRCNASTPAGPSCGCAVAGGFVMVRSSGP